MSSNIARTGKVKVECWANLRLLDGNIVGVGLVHRTKEYAQSHLVTISEKCSGISYVPVRLSGTVTYTLAK